MLELASLGAQVLNNRSVELAKSYGVQLEVLSSFSGNPGTIVKEVVKNVEKTYIAGVAQDKKIARIALAAMRTCRVWPTRYSACSQKKKSTSI